VFFALWPTAAERRALSEAAAAAVGASGGRAVPEQNLHATLAFLGGVPEARIGALAALGREVAGAWAPGALPLTLTFEALAHWTKARLLCALAGAEPALVQALAAQLKSAALAAGFSPDLKPFRTHVTLARKIAHAPARAPLASVRWQCTAIALVESRATAEGSVYSVLESALLGEAQKIREEH
jgi:2'-5' RNA ligase